MAGGRVMVEDGLFERFPAEQVFGMHNWPRLPVGQFAMRPGPMMAAADRIEIRLTGHGGHGAMPHHACDPVVAGAQIVSALQTIVARNADPIDRAVVSITQFHAGDADNVIPQTALLGGTARSFTPEMRDLIERRIGEIARGVGQALEVEVATPTSAATRRRSTARPRPNSPRRRRPRWSARTRVDRAPPPVMGAEDFAFMLERRPGSYVFIGNGGGDEAPMVHNPEYNFNDEALPYGASYWSKPGRAGPAGPLRPATRGRADPAHRHPQLAHRPPPRAVLCRCGRVPGPSARKWHP